MGLIHQYLGGPMSGSRLETQSNDISATPSAFVGYILHQSVSFGEDTCHVWVFVDPVLAVTRALQDLAVALTSCLLSSSCFHVGRDKFLRRSEAYSFEINDLNFAAETFVNRTNDLACWSKLFQRKRARGIAHLSYSELFSESLKPSSRETRHKV